MTLSFYRAISLDEEALQRENSHYPNNASVLSALSAIGLERGGNFPLAMYLYGVSAHPIALERLKMLQRISFYQNSVPDPVHSPVINFHAPTTVHIAPTADSSAAIPVQVNKIEKSDNTKLDYTLQMIDYCQNEFNKHGAYLTISKFAYFLGLSYAGTTHRLSNLRELNLLKNGLNISEQGKKRLVTLGPLENPIKITAEEIANIPANYGKRKKNAESSKEADSYLQRPPMALVFSSKGKSSSFQQSQEVKVQVQVQATASDSEDKMSIKFLTT